MNELQIGLIGLGGVAVAGVLVYNKWQEYRHRKVAEQLLRHGHDDVLLGEGEDRDARVAPAETPDIPPAPLPEPVPAEVLAPHEPYIDSPAEPAARERLEPTLCEDSRTEIAVADAIEPSVTEVSPAAQLPTPAIGAAAAHAPNAAVTDEEGVPAILVSPVIDYVARLELIDAEGGSRLLDAQQPLLSRIAKPLGWAGFNERNGVWEAVAADGNYRRLRVGLLLADRRGPLGEADLLTFVGAMQGLAEEFAAAIDLPAQESALNAAIALDQFCADVDIQIGLNLVSHGTVFPGTKIRALAEAAGMVLDEAGRFVRCDDDGNVLYTLANQESIVFSVEAMRTLATHGLLFTLDVPRVAHGDRVFAQMLDVARRMADTLHGVLVDDNRRPLTEAALDPFRRQIGQYQAQLAMRGIPAGGPLALRLFS